MLYVPSLYTALRKTTWGGLLPVLVDSVERSPLSKRDRGGMGRKTKRDEMVRIEESNANREIMRDALWDAKSSSFNMTGDKDYKIETRALASNKGTRRSNRLNARDEDGAEEDESTSHIDRRRRSSRSILTLERLKKMRKAKKNT